MAVDSQGKTPRKPTYKELKQEAQRKAKAWYESRRRARPWVTVVMADHIPRMDVEATVEDMARITGDLPAQQPKTGDPGHEALMKEEYVDRREEDMDE